MILKCRLVIFTSLLTLLAVIENSQNDAFLPFLSYFLSPFPSCTLSIFICSFQSPLNFSATATLGAEACSRWEVTVRGRNWDPRLAVQIRRVTLNDEKNGVLYAPFVSRSLTLPVVERLFWRLWRLLAAVAVVKVVKRWPLSGREVKWDWKYGLSATEPKKNPLWRSCC